MANHFFPTQPKQMAFSMSSPYSHTVSATAGQASLEEEEDNDICPVCDGECTCSNNVSRSLASPPPVVVSTGPLSMEELSRHYKVVTSSSTPTSQQRTPQLHQHPVPKPPAPKPSLKIKLTVPQSLLAKKRATPSTETTPRPHQCSNHGETMFAEESDDEPLAGPSSLVRSPPLYDYPFKPAPKKRGRPRKVLPPAARDLSVDSIPTRPSTSPSHRRTNPKASIIGRQKRPAYATKLVKSIKNRPPPTKKRTKKPGTKRRRPAYIDSDASSESSLSDDEDMFGISHSYETGGVDAGRFPTFVSASALSSMDSDNDSSDLSMSDFSDSSMQNEEEGFILSEIQQRARVNRELLGDNAKKISQNNEWVIRPRKKSVGLSDAEVDTEATEDEEEDEALAMDEADEDDDDDETDGKSVGGSGLVTGWSEEDEESSFDADLFFANLSTTSDSDSSSDESMHEVGLNDGDDDTISDTFTEDGLHHMREGLESLPLEIVEGWDGQLVFTNGLRSANTGLIHLDFERDASKIIVPPEAQGSPEVQEQAHESDVEMTSYGSDGDDGYATDGGEGDGETTDEELVDDNDLPNERAMQLFNFPQSVKSINPLSTVSPMVTPAKNRFVSGPYDLPPIPADILSGDVFYDSDDMDELLDDESRRRRALSISSKGSKSGPRKGIFTVVQQARRQAVIDDKHSEIPSPHPRFKRDRRARKISAIEALIKKHFNDMKQELALAAAATPVASGDMALLPSTEISAAARPSSTGVKAGTQTPSVPFDLDDVLDASFLHAEPESTHALGDSAAEGPPESGTADDDSDSNTREVKHLQRWDVISVSAFRQTREHAAIMDSPSASTWTPGPRHTPASSSDYGLRASPFSTMLWPTNKRSKREGKGVARKMSVSPLLQPTRADGDATPTNKPSVAPYQPQQQTSDHKDKYVYKSKKEMKREKKMKRKGFNSHGHHANHHHHSHHHYPNSKTRSTGSVQRSGFVSGVPPLNL